MPDKPQVIFDGACSFCRIWIEYWKHLTGDAADYVPSQDVPAVQLILPDGTQISAAHAVFQILAYSPQHRWPIWLYQHFSGFAALSEALYRFIAAHRNAAYSITRILFGTRLQPATYGRVAWLFSRLLGFTYLIAFASCGLQIVGLIGARGILPLAQYLSAVRQPLGLSAYWYVPTVFWLSASDVSLRIVCVLGVLLSVLILVGLAQRVCFIAAFLLYLSICSGGQDFLSFQWDMLLLEAGFLAIFLSPSQPIVWLYRLLVFRLMFLSGAVKLLSHDPSWRNLTALDYHYWTQPLPTPLAWYVNLLPAWFQRASTAGVFVVELGLPFLIFLPRRLRLLAAGGFVSLQLLILLTGNYTFFNLLAIFLCIFLLDDSLLPRRVGLVRRQARFAVPLLVVLGVLGFFQILENVDTVPRPVTSILRLIAPFGIVNSYGLFAVMTTTRPEIILQGSDDGATWLDYEFKFKPGNPLRAPRWVAPYQPRLDWQMWFAALSNWRSNPWFVNFLARLLQGSPDVLNLLGNNPFPTHPPRYVRALVYQYRFTGWSERRQTGAWWKREPAGTYLRAISLDDFQQK